MRVPSLQLIVPFVAIVVLTICIRVGGLDMAAARSLHGGAGGWRLDDDPVLRFIFNFGVTPAALVGVVSIIVLVGGIGNRCIARYRKISAYLILCLAIGPGIIANSILKNHWGRPRPSQLLEFGGKFQFEPVLWMDFSSDGKSFPSGHATMGFYFFAVALVLPSAWKWRRYAAGAFAILLGGSLGYARMAQGGHFLSDVAWAAAIMWFVPLGLLSIMRLNEDRFYHPGEKFRSAPPWVAWASMTAITVFLALATLARPYTSRGEIFRADESGQKISTIFLDTEATILTKRGERLLIESETKGYGFPKSSLKYQVTKEGENVRILSTKKGFFTKLHTTLTITLPEHNEVKIISKDAQEPALLDAQKTAVPNPE